ncbi:glycoside hydrolase superfamily [Fomitopsis betulina]|nr:glycoside hydrolase superfamily [Fomitopsis betulina]
MAFRSYDPVPNPVSASSNPDFDFELHSPRMGTFMGAALNDEASFSDTRPSSVTGDAASSVRALNRQSQADPSLYDSQYRDDPRELHPTEFASPTSPTAPYANLNEKRRDPTALYASPRQRSRRRIFLIIGGVSLIIIVVVVVVAVTLATRTSGSSQGGGKSGSGSTGGKTTAAITGGDGSTVTMDDGSTFTYSNKFGGYWYFDPQNPLTNYARAQSWTPAMNETFEYGTDNIRGVNLGGWLVPEPFIAPALFEPYANSSYPAVDEWTLSYNLMNETSQGGLKGVMTNHYETFITEQDFAEIAGAGLNHVRIPIGYWAIETWNGEPFLEKVSWTYFLKAIEWARKYGLRINLDFHALPGSQNGWNHSGKLGSINVLYGPMGFANAQRSLGYIRTLAEFISQPQYSNVVTIFGITNEPMGTTMGQSQLSSYYVQAYEIVRTASGIGAGKGPYVLYHDGFYELSQWAGFLTGADRIAIDNHPYICFGGQSSEPYSARLTVPCDTWGADVNTSMTAFGLTTAGEFSNAINDCGLWVNGVNDGTRYEGTYAGASYTGDCAEWVDWQNWDDSFKSDIEQFALASMSALQNFFFWTWKIGNSSVSGKVESPQWSYQLGLQYGWMPTDPRMAEGVCNPSSVFNPPLSAWQTGGQGAGTTSGGSQYAWPPATISNPGYSSAASVLPSYTATGGQVILAVPTFSASSATVSASVGDGWENAKDTAQLYTGVQTCNYLFPWVGPTAPPSPLCGNNKRDEYDTPAPTPAPAGSS